MPPRFFFVIDVSTQAVQSGSLPVVCKAIRDSLDRLPGNDRTQIGFLTFDSSLHFFNLKSSLSQPQMLVCTPTPHDTCLRMQCLACCRGDSSPMLCHIDVSAHVAALND